MAVSVADKTLTFTAQGDQYPGPIVVKSISWTGVTTIGHLLAIAQSSTLGDNSKVLYKDEASNANYVNKKSIELHYPRGIEITDLDSGEVQVYFS